MDMNTTGEDFAFLVQCLVEGTPPNHVSLSQCLTNHYGRRARSSNAILREARVAEFLKFQNPKQNKQNGNGRRGSVKR